MQRMLDEGTHSWYYMIVCCKIPQPTCKENSTSNHLTQHSWSIIILLILGRICIPWPKQKTGLQWQDWKWRNQLLFHVKCLAPNLQKAPFHVCFIQKILQKRPNSLHDSYIYSCKIPQLTCKSMHLTFILLSFLIFFGSQSRSITNTVDRPAEAGLEEVEEPVALPCQIPGTKQLTKCSDLSAPNTFNATNARRRNTFLILHDSLL